MSLSSKWFYLAILENHSFSRILANTRVNFYHFFILSFSPGSINVDSRLLIVKVTPSQRLNFCRSIGDLFNESVFANLTVSGLRIQSLGKTFQNF